MGAYRAMVQEAVAIFKAPGMNIAGQLQKLRKNVNELDGILHIQVNYILDTVSISYDSDRVSLSKIKKTIDAQWFADK
jgi:copper chaperone CopZ